jgi:signal transduction histidine kinase
VLVRELLDLSRVDAGQVPLQRQDVRLADLVGRPSTRPGSPTGA